MILYLPILGNHQRCRLLKSDDLYFSLPSKNLVLDYIWFSFSKRILKWCKVQCHHGWPFFHDIDVTAVDEQMLPGDLASLLVATMLFTFCRMPKHLNSSLLARFPEASTSTMGAAAFGV